jgi:hypothetical protein
LPGGSDGEFLLDDKTKTNFLCNLGYAAPDEGAPMLGVLISKSSVESF